MPAQKIDDTAALTALLDAVQVGTLATTDEDGAPYLIPLNFVLHEGAIYFHSSLTGRKLDNIAREPRVCFSAYRMHRLVLGENSCDCSVRYDSVLCFGKAALMPDGPDKQAALRLLSEKHFEHELEAPDMQACRKTAVVRIEIEQLTGKRNVD